MTTTKKQYKQFGDKRRAQKGTMFPLARDTKIVNKCGKKIIPNMTHDTCICININR